MKTCRHCQAKRNVIQFNNLRCSQGCLKNCLTRARKRNSDSSLVRENPMKMRILFKQAFSQLQSAVFFIFCALIAQIPALASQFSNETREAQSVLRPGDILLVPLNCYVCNAIEKETGVPYSHSVVVANEAPDQSQIFVLRSLGKDHKNQPQRNSKSSSEKTKFISPKTQRIF